MESPSVIKEDLLHYVWKTKQFNLDNLVLVDRRKLIIDKFGFQNSDAGPDFTHGQITIDQVKWVGNIEMHTLSSMWKKHNHNDDPAYDNVILHVVYEDDDPVRRKDGTLIPTLELEQRIHPKVLKNYAQLINNSLWIPCERLIHKTDTLKSTLWLRNLAIERLKRKTDYILNLLEKNNGDWEQVCFVLLSRYLGSRVNVFPMELMASGCDIRNIYKNSDNILAIEAILYGIAGMLQVNFKDDYPKALKKEYKFYSNKYDLRSINPVSWKFSRMRPANFPTIRISQLATIIYQEKLLFRSVVEAPDIHTIREIFNVNATPYWDNHFKFDEESIHKPKKLGTTFTDLLIINVVAPLMFVYGIHLDNDEYKEKAIAFLEHTKPENNNITRKWKDLGLPSKDAMMSQSLIQLKSEYCDHKRCLECAIGNAIIQF